MPEDTRYLSEVRLEVGGARPVALSYAAVDDRCGRRLDERAAAPWLA